MAAEIRKLAAQFKEYPKIEAYLNLGAQMATKLGVPESLTVEIPTVNKEAYRRILKEMEATGYDFIASIRPVSVGNLLVEDGQRKSKRLGFVNDSAAMRNLVPSEMKVAINPDRFKIEGSSNLSTDAQKKKIKKEEARWKNRLPKDIRPFVSMRMVDLSTLSQLEDSYMDRNGGKLLLPDYYARTDVQTVPGDVALVGRRGPAGRRLVVGWGRGRGVHGVFAVSVVVLPRESAV